jgi:hypothetical protein
MGWRVVGDLPVRIRVRRPARFALGLRSLRAPARGPGSQPPVDALPAAEVLASDEGLKKLVGASFRPPARLSTAHTADTLTWRYGLAPALDYRAIGDTERGLAIFRVRPRGDLWEATVAEILTPDEDPDKTRELLRDVGRAARVDHVTCLLPEGSAAWAGSRRAGFVRSPLGMTLTARPLKESVIDPLEMGSWALTLGDVEVF